MYPDQNTEALFKTVWLPLRKSLRKVDPENFKAKKVVRTVLMVQTVDVETRDSAVWMFSAKEMGKRLNRFEEIGFVNHVLHSGPDYRLNPERLGY